MKKHNQLAENSRFFVIVILGCLSIIGISAPHPVIYQQEDNYKRLARLIEETNVDDLKITNHTSAFNIAKKEKTPQGEIHLVLQNGYDKRITAYEISIGSTTTLIDAILSTHQDGIAPGDSKDELLPIDFDPDIKKVDVAIRAVIFEDGASDGNPESIKEIQDYRLGEYMQISVTLRLLSSASNSLNEASQIALDQARAGLLTKTDSLPLYVRFGISDTQKRLSHYIDNIKNMPNKESKSGLATLIDYSKTKTDELRKQVELSKGKDQ